MSETTFIRLHEYNDNEGESWNWWLQLTGNEGGIAELAGLLTTALDDDDDPCYALHADDVEPESVVDKLVEYAESGYYATHNKVLGTFTCPADFGEALNDLYKGGIRDYFKGVQPSPRGWDRV
jgi:hypothetical protein